MGAALETGNIYITDSVNTERGLYKFKGKNVFDRNYDHGGFGKITREQVIVINSNIGIFKTYEEAFGNNTSFFLERLKRMSLEEPSPEKQIIIDTKMGNWLSQGIGIKLSPIQLLTFYNAIANNGMMVYEDKVLDPMIASETTIKNLQSVLTKVITKGTGRLAQSEKISMAGKTGGSHLYTTLPDDAIIDPFDIISFCGYFPVENPQYTCLVMVYSSKEKLPSYGTVAVRIFKELAEKTGV